MLLELPKRLNITTFTELHEYTSNFIHVRKRDFPLLQTTTVLGPLSNGERVSVAKRENVINFHTHNVARMKGGEKGDMFLVFNIMSLKPHIETILRTHKTQNPVTTVVLNLMYPLFTSEVFDVLHFCPHTEDCFRATMEKNHVKFLGIPTINLT